MNLKLLYIIIITAILSSCSSTRKLSNRTFISYDSIKKSSLKFIDDSTCIYRQRFICNVEPPFNELYIKCHYIRNRQELILKNITSNPDSMHADCFKIPECKLLKCFSETDSIINHSDTIIRGKVALSMYEMYGYFNNISVDTMEIRGRRIKYDKQNTCVPYVMYVNTLFTEK